MLMKQQRTIFAKRYLAALQAHLGGNVSADRRRAQALGKEALAQGLATLDLAGIHQQAVISLAASPNPIHSRTDSIKAASVFFAQALVPLEGDRQAIRVTNQHLLERNETLRRHMAALAQSNRRFEREIVRRKAGEVKIELAKERYRRLFLAACRTWS